MAGKGNCAICGEHNCKNWASSTFGTFYLCKKHFYKWIVFLNDGLKQYESRNAKEMRREELLKEFLDNVKVKVILI